MFSFSAVQTLELTLLLMLKPFKILSKLKKEYRYAPLIVGGLTGVLTTYALVAMWPERKTVGIALAGSGLWSAYNGVKMFR
jgi:hypothetical protein